MAFRTANPHSGDYYTPFPDWIINAIPGAAELRDKAAEARGTLDVARRSEVQTRAKLSAISRIDNGGYSPTDTVKRSTWDRADDAYRFARAAAETAQRASDRAHRTYWEHVMDGQDAEDFIAQTEPLFAEASRRAQEHLDALEAALTDRDNFAESLGRTISAEGGTWSLRDALSTVTAYVAAGLDDEDEVAWRYVNDTLGNSYALTSTKKTVVDACRAIRALDIPASEKLNQYKAAMSQHGISGRTVR